MLIDYNEEKVYYQVSCKAIAVMAQFMIIVNVLFISWLTFHLFAFVVFFKDLKRLEWLYISSSVLIPLLVYPSLLQLWGSRCFMPHYQPETCRQLYTTRPDVVGITEQFTLYYAWTSYFSFHCQYSCDDCYNGLQNMYTETSGQRNTNTLF